MFQLSGFYYRLVKPQQPLPQGTRVGMVRIETPLLQGIDIRSPFQGLCGFASELQMLPHRRLL